MKKYSIKEGQRDFKPFDSGILPFNLNKVKEIQITFNLDESCWYNWGTDNDQYDWNKLAGVSKYLTFNNSDSSTMIVWRPALKEGFFEISVLTNWVNGYLVGEYWKEGNNEVLLTVPASVNVYATISLANTERNVNPAVKDYEICLTSEIHDKEICVKHIKGDYNLVRRTGCFFGGKNNASGPYGGEASKDMHLYYDYKIIKK